MVSKFLFIEGTANETNDELRKGFEVLFKQSLGGKMPRIIMGDGKEETIDKFKNRRLEQSKGWKIKRFLLIDLDRAPQHRQDDIKKYELTEFSGNCFYMIQEMETWFISQAKDVLDKYYKSSISDKISKKAAVEFDNPDKEIEKLLNPLGKEYHKVKDEVKMLRLLKLEKLMNDFPDVKNLIEELKKA